MCPNPYDLVSMPDRSSDFSVVSPTRGAGPILLAGFAPSLFALPIRSLFTLFTLTVGLAFVAVAVTAPLMQARFAWTTHPHARAPYFLYAVGSAVSLTTLVIALRHLSPPEAIL